MQTCSNCGANLLPGAESCVYCGHVNSSRPTDPEGFRPPPASAPEPAAAPEPATPFGASPGGPGGPPPPGPWTPSAQDSAQQFGPSPSAWAQPAIGSPGAPAPNFMLWIVLSIVTFSMCGSVLAIPGAILAFLAKSEWERGDHVGGERKLGLAKILIVLNLVLTALLVVAYVALMIFLETV